MIKTYKYLSVHLDNGVDWTCKTETVYRTAQSRLYFLRKLRFYSIFSKVLDIFYQSVVSIFYAGVCWGSGIEPGDTSSVLLVFDVYNIMCNIHLHCNYKCVMSGNICCCDKAIIHPSFHPHRIPAPHLNIITTISPMQVPNTPSPLHLPTALQHCLPLHA